MRYVDFLGKGAGWYEDGETLDQLCERLEINQLGDLVSDMLEEKFDAFRSYISLGKGDYPDEVIRDWLFNTEHNAAIKRLGQDFFGTLFDKWVEEKKWKPLNTLRAMTVKGYGVPRNVLLATAGNPEIPEQEQVSYCFAALAMDKTPDAVAWEKSLQPAQNQHLAPVYMGVLRKISPLAAIEYLKKVEGFMPEEPNEDIRFDFMRRVELSVDDLFPHESDDESHPGFRTRVINTETLDQFVQHAGILQSQWMKDLLVEALDTPPTAQIKAALEAAYPGFIAGLQGNSVGPQNVPEPPAPNGP